MKRILAITLAALTLLALCACGSSDSSSKSYAAGAPEAAYAEAYYDGYYPEAPMEMAEEAYYDAGYWADAPAAGTAAAQQPDPSPEMYGVKMIYTAHMEMESTEFDSAMQAIANLTAKYGGYYESSSMSDRGSARSADFSVRVPAAWYRAFLTEAGTLCHVTYQQESAEDVSETYYDTAGRLETQKTKLTRLRQLLAEANHMDDIITLENEISDTEEAIDRLSGTLRHYDALVSYSTVYISLREVKVFTEVIPVTESFGSRFASAFKSGLQDFGEALGDIAVALAYSWIWLVIIAAVVVVILLLTKKRRIARREARKNAPPVIVPSYSSPAQRDTEDKDE